MAKKKIHRISPTSIAQNRHARHEYFIEQEFEAGLLLQGWEVKSLRAGRANISDSYVLIKDSRAYLLGTTFQPLITASSYVVCDPVRTRQLLLNKYELNSMFGKVNRKGYTLVALSLYWKNSWVKIKIGVAKGKKKYDKRIDIKEREWQLDKSRIIKYTNR